jgi:pyruvate/2-oxoglutarate dehydrogenase complex dihydrolipoamide acyltransferase (E2) component
MNSILIIFFLSYGLYAFFNNFKFWIIYIIILIVYYFLTKQNQKNINISYKINHTTWSSPYDPHTYTTLKLDITKIIPYLKQKSEQIKENITPTIFAIKLMALVLKKYPEVYGFIKYGRYEPKDTIDICCIVQVGDGKGLANATIKSGELKNFKEIASSLVENAKILRAKKDKDFNIKMTMFKLCPTFLAGPITQIVSYLSSIGYKVKAIGLKKFEFGSFVITSIGGLGIEHSYAPIPPFTFAPLLLALCKKYDVNKKTEDGSIVKKTYLRMNFTADYRFFDPKTASSIFKDIHLFGEDPEKFENECKKYRKDF